MSILFIGRAGNLSAQCAAWLQVGGAVTLTCAPSICSTSTLIPSVMHSALLEPTRSTASLWLRTFPLRHFQ